MTAPACGPPVKVRNIRRHLAAGDEPRIGFTELAPASRSAPPAPLFLFGPGNSVLLQELFHQPNVGEVGCYTLEDATLAPTGVAIKDGTAFTSLAFNHLPTYVGPIATRLAQADLPERHVAGKLAVIYGPGHHTYGHWLVDFLPRLWVLARTGHDIRTLRYAMPPDLTRTAAELLARFGISESQLVPYRYWRESVRAEMLLMPTGLRSENRMSALFAPATSFWTARLLAGAPSGAGRGERLFLTRANVAAQRMMTNRAAIEAIARQRGFAVVAPETLTLPEQAAMFAGARIIAGEYGSALHGSVYAAAGAVTIGLRGTARHPSFVQSGIAAALGQQAGYVLGRTELVAGTGEVEQRFTVQPEDFERALDVAEAAV